METPHFSVERRSYNLEEKISVLTSEERDKELKGTVHNTDLEEADICYKIEEKQKFVKSILDFMEMRGSASKEFGPDWFEDSKLTSERYNLILEKLVFSSDKEDNLKRFVSLFPFASWEIFDWQKLNSFR